MTLESLNLKAESQALAKELGIQPASIIEIAMTRGAILALEQFKLDVVKMRTDHERDRKFGLRG